MTLPLASWVMLGTSLKLCGLQLSFSVKWRIGLRDQFLRFMSAWKLCESVTITGKGEAREKGGWRVKAACEFIQGFESQLNPFIPTEMSINQNTFFAKFQQKLSILIRILLENKETWQLFVPFSKIILMFRRLKWNLWRQWDKNMSMMIERY